MSATWLERFSEVQIIRRRGVVDHVACRDLRTGERRLVIATKEARLRELFDTIARLHGELSHPNIPALDHRGRVAGTEYVALGSGAFVDLETMLPIAIANHGFAPGATVAFLDAVIGAVRAAHARQICIGAFAGSNVVLSETHIDVIGWGYPTSETDRRVVLDDTSVMHTAWEAAFGAPASPNGDLDAVGRFLHAILPATAMPPILLSTLQGKVDDGQIAELVKLVGELEDAAHARDPANRSWDRYIATMRELRERLDARADEAVLRSELARLCTIWRAQTGLTVAHDGTWFSVRSSARVELERRPNLRDIVRALAERRRDAPGEAIAPEGLLAAGWPGEQVSAEAGRNRVRVAVSTLRSMGLREVLLSRDDGYLFDPDVGLRLE